MKKSIYISIFAALLFLGTTTVNAQWKKIKGSGNVTTSNITTQAYDEVAAVGSMTVILVSGNEGAIKIEADDNLHQYLDIESDGNKLKVKMQKGINYQSKNDIVVTVPFKDISTVSLTGSGDVMGKQTIKGDNLSFMVTGSGDLALDAEGNQIDAKVTGSGDMKLSGKAENLEVKVSGSGDFMGFDLSTNNTEVYVSGSGDAEVVSKNRIKARVTGSGDIDYKGNPSKSDTKVMGSGRISSN